MTWALTWKVERRYEINEDSLLAQAEDWPLERDRVIAAIGCSDVDGGEVTEFGMEFVSTCDDQGPGYPIVERVPDSDKPTKSEFMSGVAFAVNAVKREAERVKGYVNETEDADERRYFRSLVVDLERVACDIQKEAMKQEGEAR